MCLCATYVNFVEVIPQGLGGPQISGDGLNQDATVHLSRISLVLASAYSILSMYNLPYWLPLDFLPVTLDSLRACAPVTPTCQSVDTGPMAWLEVIQVLIRRISDHE